MWDPEDRRDLIEENLWLEFVLLTRTLSFLRTPKYTMLMITPPFDLFTHGGIWYVKSFALGYMPTVHFNFSIFGGETPNGASDSSIPYSQKTR